MAGVPKIDLPPEARTLPTCPSAVLTLPWSSTEDMLTPSASIACLPPSENATK